MGKGGKQTAERCDLIPEEIYMPHKSDAVCHVSKVKGARASLRTSHVNNKTVVKSKHYFEPSSFCYSPNLPTNLHARVTPAIEMNDASAVSRRELLVIGSRK